MKVAICAILTSSLVTAAGAGYRLDPAALTVSFSVREFQPNLPFSGRFNAVAIDPSDPRHVLAASDSGGLFRSRDGGSSWSHVSRLPVTNLKHVVFHPDDPRVVLLTADRDFKTSNGAGIWRSADGGESWARARLLCAASPPAWGISIEPASGHVYVATECGVHLSRNRGEDWENRAVPTNPRLYSILTLGEGLVLVGGANGVSRSEDAGLTWTQVRSDAALSQHAFTVAPGPNGRRVVYLVDLSSSGTVRLWESLNLGRSFRQRVEAPPGGGGCGGIPFVKARPSGDPAGDVAFHLYYGETCQLHRVSAWFVTRPPRPGLPRPTPTPRFGSFTRLEIDHDDTRHLALDDSGAPAFLSTDGGVERPIEGDRVWRLVGGGPTGLNALQMFEVTGQLIDSPPRYDLYFGTQDNSVWASPDDGRTWPYNAGGEGFAIDLDRRVASETDARVNLKACSSCFNYESSALFDQGRTFPEHWNDPFPALPELGDPVRVRPDVQVQADLSPFSGRWGFYSTPDQGATWTRLVRFGPRDQVTYLPRISRSRKAGAEPLAVAYQGLRTAGGSFTFARINDLLGPSPDLVFPDSVGLRNLGVISPMWYDAPVFAVDPQDPSHLIASDVGAFPGMRRSVDGGESFVPLTALTDLITDGGRLRFWERYRPGPTQSLATAISFCPDDPNLVLVGTDEAGVFFSADRGASWQAVPGSNGMRHITSFHWQSAGSVLVSTYGRGLWRLTVNLRFPGLFFEAACVKPCSVKSIGQPAPGRPDRAFMVLRGRVTDARATNGRLERLVSTPGGAILMFSDAEGEPIERDQDFDLGSFEGLPEVGELARQGQVVLGFTLVQGRVQGVLLSEETVEIEEPGAFLPFKDLGKPTSGQESRPTLTATAAESLGGVAMLTGGERRLRLRGQGFSPRRRVSLRVDGVLQKGVVRTDAKGAFATVLVLNLGSLPHGAHEVEATQALGRQRVLSDRTHFLRRHQDPQPPRLAEP